MFLFLQTYVKISTKQHLFYFFYRNFILIFASTKTNRIMNLYNLDEIAASLGVSYKSAQNKITKAGFSKVKTINKRAMYSEFQLNVLKERKNVIVYEIYESKMNYLKLEEL